jgi:hypothetical protein
MSAIVLMLSALLAIVLSFVSEMSETVSHKQIPVYFDQMVDDVFLNGTANASCTPRKAREQKASPR